MTTDYEADRVFALYLRERLRRLEQCTAEIEEKVSDDRIDLGRKIDAGDYNKDDPGLGQFAKYLEVVVANTFRYVMLVGVCTFLEESIKEIAKRRVTDYDVKIKAAKGKTWLKQHMRLLKAECGIDVTPIGGDVTTFRHLLALRNHVVHAWGNIAAARKPNAVRDAVKHVDTAAISDDGYIIFGDQVVPLAINTAEHIADHVLVSTLNVSIT